MEQLSSRRLVTSTKDLSIDMRNGSFPLSVQHLPDASAADVPGAQTATTLTIIKNLTLCFLADAYYSMQGENLTK